MDIKVDSLNIIRVLYNAFENQKTLKVNLTYADLKKELSYLEIDDIKACVEYLEGHNYLTYRNHKIFNDICITSNGIDYYLENFN